MRLDYLLLGYRKVSPREGSLAGAVTALISGGLTARVNKNGEFLIPEYRYKKYKDK